MKTLRTSDETVVDVLQMEMYPDGCLLAAELASIFVPAAGSLPPGTLDFLKAAIADGNMSVAMAAVSKVGDDVAKGLFAGFGQVLMQMADRERFLRISGQLLATLTVTRDGKRIELLDKERVNRATGGNMRLLLELIGIAARENLMSFFSGAGGTSDASASGPRT